MRRLRTFAALTLVAAIFVLAAQPAFAAIETRVVVGGPYTFNRGQPTIIAFVNCTDSETGSDLRSAATLTVTLTQGRRSVTRVKEFQCWGDDDIVIGTFRGFHPGEAFIEATLTACDAENLTDCSTSTLATQTTLVRARR
jgi:hypothetical protein